jgi:hypothetical protein
MSKSNLKASPLSVTTLPNRKRLYTTHEDLPCGRLCGVSGGKRTFRAIDGIQYLRNPTQVLPIYAVVIEERAIVVLLCDHTHP